MGVTYKLYVVPKNPEFRPSAAALVSLVDQLERQGWLPRGAKPTDGKKPVSPNSKWFERAMKAGWELVWDFDERPYEAHPLFETVPEFVREQLSSLYFAIKLECPRSTSIVPDGDVPLKRLASRGRYRFLLTIDCNKCHWDEEKPTRLRPEFEALVAKAIGTELKQIGDLH
jgi:hypothetical protein